MACRIFITVAEVSGDQHAAQLIHSLRQLDPEMVIEGLGGPEMAAAGATVHRDTVTNAAMGWRGALRALEVMKVLRWARRHFASHRPDLVIGVDSPSMNIHFARVAHEFGVPVLQYVAPQLWAWAPWRMNKLRRSVDRVACILPFEQEYFRSHGVNATFVGHPLFDQLPQRPAAPTGPHFPERPPVIGLLTGSRKSEASHNFPHLLEIAKRIRQEFSEAQFLVPTTAATDPVVEKVLAGNGSRNGSRPELRLQVGRDRFDDMVPRCDLCLTVSGTATLHVAGYGVPMIVVYRVNPFAWNAGGRWLVRTRTFALVNVLASGVGKRQSTHRVVPEFVPWYGSNEPVACAAIDLLRNPDQLQQQRRELRNLISPLDHPGASIRTAQLAIEMIPGWR